MPRKLSEEATQKQMIDPQLEKAGWYLHIDTLRELHSPSEKGFLAPILCSLDSAFKGEL